MRLVASVFMVATLFVVAGPVTAQQPSPIILTPDQITFGPPRPTGTRWAVLEGDPEKPGPFTIRSMLPANLTVAPHVHTTTEYLTVLSGIVYVGIGEKFTAREMKALPSGGFFMVPAGTPMYLMTREEATIQVQMIGPLVITYVEDPTKPK
jgi:quercetin dioxygenase-like cupin family protein